MQVKLQLDPGASIPTRAHNTDTGYDLRANKITIRILEVNGKWKTFSPEDKLPDLRECCWQAEIDTGVHIQPPNGWGFTARPNSRSRDSLFRWAFSPGTIDGNYTGSIRITLEPRFKWVDIQHIPAIGDVCAQIKPERVYSCSFEQVDTLTPTERGSNGFGSTANK